MKDKKAYVRLSVSLRELDVQDVVCTSVGGVVHDEIDTYGFDRNDWGLLSETSV